MRRAALALVLLLSGPAAEAAPSQRPVNAAEAARQKATDRDDNRAQARTAADEIVRLRQQLVALGAALFVLVPQTSGSQADAMSRVLQGVIAGIGFLGAGTIL